MQLVPDGSLQGSGCCSKWPGKPISGHLFSGSFLAMNFTGLHTHLTGLQTHLAGLQPCPHFLFLLEQLFFLQEPYPVFFAYERYPYPEVFTACFFVGIVHNLQSV
ncbi:hypothetical protein CFI03_018635 [Paenibacillus sp. ATY16]|nr:hypothetical protein [Paenibacillus sp. ATY16]